MGGRCFSPEIRHRVGGDEPAEDRTVAIER